MRIALGLEYDGNAFCGWQTQPGGCGVQDALEIALSGVAGEKIETACAGRTDTGVHALGQVVHFDTTADRPLSAWTRGTNALLPQSVAVTWSREVQQEFHARFRATGRRYVYWLLNRATRPGLLGGRAGWTHRKLDEAAMLEAAQCLLGEHDFSSFRAAECQARSPVKTVRSIDVARRGDLIRFEFVANAFLQHMVRNLVGSLVYVGSGRQPVEWMRTLLEGRDRTLAAPTFSPAGLYLAGVEYDAVWALPPIPDLRRVEDLLLAAG
ncbi:MAG TPA: tRNA pseudouridine(38-40) synthase TruA [Burkholderiales bacterium]|nr:tRNA pseudouridine(38-40) synthase TruA [Burkholderiales bacterium]